MGIHPYQDLNLPSGVVTFLFTDIEGSTTLWERDPEGMRAALARHDAILHAAITANGGQVFKLIGDAFQAAFTEPAQAVMAALEAQRRLAAESWGQSGPLRVRMGLHAGPVEASGSDFAPNHTLNRVARVMSAGHGGQVLLSAAVAELARGQLPGEVSLLNLGEHRLKGLEQREHLYQLAAPDLPAEFPPLNTLSAFPGNLPIRPTTVIGRQAEVQAGQALLMRPNLRLVTLTGPGGVGKTSLGLEIVAGLAGYFPHGVYWVPLAAIHDPNLVASAIARTMDVRERTGDPLIESLKHYLQDKRLLLLLDNFEQVIPAAQVVAELLNAAPNLKVLATSRAPLQLRGEQEFPIQPLELPDISLSTSLERLQENAAIRLFTERAQAVRPSFNVSAENARQVAEIVRRLDGLPLAIELAAARIKFLSPHDLLTRLDSRLKLLTGGPQDLPARQQTMRNAIDWSYSLLDQNTQTLFSRLSVFSGGFTLEAAESLCSLDGDLDVFEGLTTLLNNSLIRQEHAPFGSSRFAMLETIREYAHERLVASAESDLVQRQHALYFGALAGEAGGKFFSGESYTWLERVEPDHNNFRSALSFLQSEPEYIGLGWEVIFNLLWLWYRRGYLDEARLWYEKAIARALPVGDNPQRAKIREGAGLVAMWRSDLFTAAQWMDEAFEIIRQAGDPAETALLYFNRGVLAVNQGDGEKARALFEAALPLFRQIEQEWFQAMILLHLGNVALSQGDIPRAQEYMEASLSLGKQVGDQWIIASAVNNFGEIDRYQKDYAQAESSYLESRAMFQEVGSYPDVARANCSLGFVALALGDHSQASAFFQESLAQHQQLGVRRGVVECLAGLAALSGLQGKTKQAVRLFAAVRAQFAVLGAGIWPADHAEIERHLSNALSQIGQAEYDQAYEEGSVLNLEDAIYQALN